MLIDADLNEVKDVESLGSGVYEVTILKEPKLIKSSVKGTEGLEFELSFIDPATELAPGVARTIRHTVWKSEKFGWQHPGMKAMCEACAVSLTNPDTADFVGTVLNVAIITKPGVNRHTGEPRVFNEVDHVLKKV